MLTGTQEEDKPQNRKALSSLCTPFDQIGQSGGFLGTALRLFLIGDDDSLRRLPLTRYERMLRGNPKEVLPEYAGKRLRCATVFLELLDRKPMGIIEIQYAYISFDVEGRIDQNEFKKQARLALEAIESIASPRTHGRIIPARHRFAKKRLQDLYRWNPHSELESAIVNAALGKV